MVRERDSISDVLKGWAGTAGANAGSINFFFILCLIFHIIDVLTNFRELSLRIFLYIFLLVFGWLTVFKKEQGVIDVADLKMPIILSSLAFFIPYFPYNDYFSACFCNICWFCNAGNKVYYIL